MVRDTGFEPVTPTVSRSEHSMAQLSLFLAPFQGFDKSAIMTLVEAMLFDSLLRVGEFQRGLYSTFQADETSNPSNH